MQTLNVLERPVYPNLPKCKNDSVGKISRDEMPDRAWYAGILDGEGDFNFYGNNARGMGQLKLCVGNTSPEMIRRISQVYVAWNVPFHINYENHNKRNKLNPDKKPYKDKLTIVVTGMRSIRKVLLLAYPYLTSKREQATIILEYLEWRLMEMPFHTGNKKDCAEINKRREEVCKAVRAIHDRHFSFQRLPRRASTVLDLSKLEVVV